MNNRDKWTGGLQSPVFFRRPPDPPNLHSDGGSGGGGGKAYVTFTATSIEIYVRREKIQLSRNTASSHLPLFWTPLVDFVPLPLISSSWNSPSYQSPLGQVYLPLPCLQPFVKLPS